MGCGAIASNLATATPVDVSALQTAAIQTFIAEANKTASANAPMPELPTPTAEPVRLTMPALRNAEYHSSDWGDFQLVDGVYYRTPLYPGDSPQLYLTQLFEPIAYGDLNADGSEDAVVILETRNGGNGHFRELGAVLNQGGNAYNVSTAYLGDRVAVEAFQVQAGVISLDLRVHGPNDGLCCPSRSVRWRFRLENNLLIQLP